MGAAFADTWVPVPGGEVFVRSWPGPDKAGGRAPIVLLHDSLGSVGLWRDFPAALAAATGRGVVAYDRLGFGASTPRATPPGPAFMREEAECQFPALLAGLGLAATDFLVFGHSVGGGMALMIAAAHPARCRLVVTEAAQAFVEERTLDGVRAARADFRSRPEQFARLERLHGERARWVLDAWTETWLSAPFRAWSLAPVLGGVHCPVLALHGDRDEFGSAAFPERIAAGVAGPARACVLADCGHVPHREQPQDVLRLTAGFIQHHLPP